MADQAGAFASAGSEPLKDIGEKAKAAASDLKDKVSGLATASPDQLQDHASELLGVAKDAAGQATTKIKDAVSEKQEAGADYVKNLAETIRRAGREFDNDLPIAGRYFDKAATQFEGVAETVRSGEIKDLVKATQSFARRQPTLFLGIAALAGFAAIRFLNSSSLDGEADDGQADQEAG